MKPCLYAGGDVIVGIRPEDLVEESETSRSPNAVLKSTADLVEAMGSEMLVHFTVDAERVVTEDTQELERDAARTRSVAGGPRTARSSPGSHHAPGYGRGSR